MKTRALLLALPLVALSCREGTQSVQIQEICFPPDDCEWGNSCDTVLGGNPIIDTEFAPSAALVLALQVANQLQDNSDENIRVNTNDAHVDEIVVEYEGVAIPEQTRLTNQRVPTGSTQVIFATVVPPGHESALNASIQTVALLRMRGYYDDGTRFETAEFPIAVDHCTGCVTSCGALEVCGGFDAQEPKTCFDPEGATSP